MKKHRNKIIAAVIVVALLAGAWFVGGSYSKGADVPPVESSEPIATPVPSAAQTPAPTTTTIQAPPTVPPIKNTARPSPGATPTEPTTTSDPEAPTPTQEIIPETGKDIYQTDPVPSGKPLPVEPQDAVVGDGSFTVTLSVRCDTLLDNIDKLDVEKHELVPEDGVIFAAATVTVYEGESVFNVLQREMRRAKIHMEFVNTPIYNSAYIEGINNLYEFDGGELSGWMYSVTPSDTGQRWFPNYGCSRYQLKAGDVIEWIYTCDLGRDIGGGYATGAQT